MFWFMQQNVASVNDGSTTSCLSSQLLCATSPSWSLKNEFFVTVVTTIELVVTTIESMRDSKSERATSLLADTIIRAKLWLQQRIYAYIHRSIHFATWIVDTVIGTREHGCEIPKRPSVSFGNKLIIGLLIGRIVPDKTETHVESIPANVFRREDFFGQLFPAS